MPKIEESVDVNVPVRVAYDQWTQFEEFPRFMDGIESVKQLDDTRLHWIAKVGGVRTEWDAEITQQEPDQRIAWKATSGAENGGAVDFHRINDGCTRVNLTMDIEPDGIVEKIGSAVGVPSRQVSGSLDRFKEFVEARPVPTGEWRGRIEQTDTQG